MQCKSDFSFTAVNDYNSQSCNGKHVFYLSSESFSEGVNLLYPNRELLPQQGGLIAKAGPVYKISCLVERFGFMSKVHLCTYLGA